MANKVGRPRCVDSPEHMGEMFHRYRQWCKTNPRYRTEVTKEGLQAIPLERPLTIVGFYAYCNREEDAGGVAHYFDEPDRFPEFRGICTRIRQEIQSDQIEGGMVNLYNPQLTARLNGLVDKQEHAVKVEKPIFTGIDLDVEENHGTEENRGTP